MASALLPTKVAFVELHLSYNLGLRLLTAWDY